MLRRQTVQKVLRLLSEGVPIRQVARTIGVSRVTVQTIHRGTHASYRRDPTPRDTKGEIHFCERCHVLVEFPCVACAIRDYRGDFPTVDEFFEPLGVDLLPEDYKRYLEIKRRKENDSDEWEKPANIEIRRIDAARRRAA